ncbi:MAG TPA: DMT family transporter [Beijerinckiaceae bacterium]|jgi:drug/metabolite transporter (DMT)-like permease
MPARDFALLAFVCLIWASHNIISKLVVAGMEVPPLFYAAIRFAIVGAITAPWLLPLPRPLWRPALVGFFMGGGGFALFFLGIQTATPSSAAIVAQLGIPLTALLSVTLLGESFSRRRLVGTVLTVVGVVVVMIEPDGASFSRGLLFVAGSALVGSLGAVMMKQVEGVRPIQFQALVGATSVLPLLTLTSLLEQRQFDAAFSAGWPFVAALVFSVVLVSLVSHSLYYRLIARHDANLIAPLMLMMPLMTVALGHLVTGDRLDAKVMAGAALAILGVLVITRPEPGAQPAA